MHRAGLLATALVVETILVACTGHIGGAGSAETAETTAATPGTRSTPSTDGGTTSPDGSTNVDAGPVGPDLGACSGASVEPDASKTISAFFDSLPYSNPTGATKDEYIDTIIKTCQVFGPPASTGFEKKHCWAHLASAMLKESSYDPNAYVIDGYATRDIHGTPANDPTVGLLQIRFSSTVRDYATYGSAEKLACVGCTFPADFASHVDDEQQSTFWAVTGPQANLSLMKSPRCNIALGAWYYYMNATGNGGGSATYASQYCEGKGTAGNLITGLLSHLDGAEGGHGVISNQGGIDALQSNDPGGYDYVTNIKASFDKMLGPISGTHPFFRILPPSPSQYCR
ncbi:hypothetical protein [Labilithrix luteola]|uniref:hypothetical protein n=1 Tax=Labilithrix luteola TaxID=1391654 RepID=UPI0011BAA726|nr:hypothetical protein [Labilithrix luteola]